MMNEKLAARVDRLETAVMALLLGVGSFIVFKIAFSFAKDDEDSE